MKKVNVQKRRSSQKGFTLVELAVVMIIVGLLIGGILKGQELITNAQVASVVTQVKAIDAGMSTFRDSYRAVPGDMATAVTRLPNCSSALNCADGDGDGIIDEAADGTTATAGDEAFLAFKHMALADVIGGVDPSAAETSQFGVDFPETALGGGLVVGHTSIGAPPGTFGANFLGGHYATLTQVAGTAAADNNGPLNASQAARIDRKMDDGNAENGSVRGSAGTCSTGGIYNEATGSPGCNMLFRVQG